nr:MAG TPA: hypothetical protein [Caudoviricetes sp.]
MNKTIPANATHTAFRDAVVQAMQPFKNDLSALEILALTSHLVGQLIALQDQTQYTASQVITVVKNNIELGNKEVVDDLRNVTGGTA